MNERQNAAVTNKASSGVRPLPADFQVRVFKTIAVQRPAVTAYIKQIRRKNPAVTPA